MATSQDLTLIFKILTSGQSDLIKVAQAVKALAENVKEVPKTIPIEAAIKSAAESARVFSDAFGKGLDLIVVKGKNVVEQFRQIAKTPVDFDVSKASGKVDLLVTKGKQVVDLLSSFGVTTVDFDVTKGTGKVDVLVGKGKQLIDLLTKVGTTKVDFDVTKPTKEMVAAAAAAIKLAATMEQLKDRSNTAIAAMSERIASVQRQLRELGANKLALVVDSSNIAAFEAKLKGLTTAASNTSNAVRGVGGASKTATGELTHFGGATKSLGDSMSNLTREALFVRRAIFALGFIALGKEILDTVVSFDKLRAQFQAVFQEKAGDELEFIKVQADRLGISVTSLGDQYAKFMTAIKGTAIEGEKGKQVFLATAEAAARLSLSQEDLNGSLIALQQIASKGRLSLEELRQQLGDRLPGAVRIAAEAMGITQQKLFALIQTGSIDSATFLAGFGEALRKNFGTDQNTRIATLASELERVKNSFKLLIDEAFKGGGSDAIKKVADSFSKFAQDPATIKGLQDIVKWLSELTTTVIQNAGVILKLAEAVLVLKVAGLGLSLFATLADGLMAFGASAGVSAVGIGALNKALVILRAILVPLVVLVATFTTAYLATTAVLEHFAAKAEEAAKKAAKLSKAISDVVVHDAAANAIKALVDMNKEYSESIIETSIELGKYTVGPLSRYIDKLAEAVVGINNQNEAVKEEIAATQARIAIIENSTTRTREQGTELAKLRSTMTDLVAKQKELTGKSLEFSSALAKATERIRFLQPGLKALDEISFENLTAAQQRIVGGFDELIKQGKSVRDAIDKAIPPEFGQGTIQGIIDTIQALRVLEAQGKITATQLREGLASELKKMTGDELNKFQINAEFAFRTARIGAAALTELLKGALTAALNKLGIDFELAGTKISKSFADALSTLAAIAQNAEVTGKQLKAAFEVLIDQAKTIEELEALRAKMQQLEVESGKFSAALADSFLRLEDKIRLLKGTMDNALGDSFKRFGIQSKKQLDAVAEQAEIDFTRIKDSGLASLEELKQAFAKFAADVMKSTGGILPFKLKLEAFRLDAFDVLVKAAETAADRIKKAFDAALGSVATLDQLKALSDAIFNTWERGRIGADAYLKAIIAIADKNVSLLQEVSATNQEQIRAMQELKKAIGEMFREGVITANQYAKALDDITTKTLELAMQAEAGFAGALARLGVQTKDQLKALSEQLKIDFDFLTNAGVLSSQQLAIAFEKYAAAAIAANNGVADSFLQAEASSLGLQDVLDKLVAKADKFADAIARAVREVTTPALDKLSNDDLLRSLDTSLKGNASGRSFTTQEVIDGIIAELGRRGLDSQGGRLRGGATGTGAPATGGQTNNFIFNEPNITPEGVKQSVIPALDRHAKRTG